MGIFNMKCSTCGKTFASTMARKDHERMAHLLVVEEIVDTEIVAEVIFEGETDHRARTNHSADRLMIEQYVSVDRKRLYGDISKAMAYMEEMRDRLQKYGGCSLMERWTGYETMEMVFVYTRRETEQEYTERQSWLAGQRAYAAKKEKEEKERADRMEQYRALRREFG